METCNNSHFERYVVFFVIGLAYMIFVMNPFYFFLIFAHLKFWLTLYEWSKWPRWTNYAFFLTAFLVIQFVIALPWNLSQNLYNLFFELGVGTDKQLKKNFLKKIFG